MFAKGINMTQKEKILKLKYLKEKINNEHRKGNYNDPEVIDMMVECTKLMIELEDKKRRHCN